MTVTICWCFPISEQVSRAQVPPSIREAVRCVGCDIVQADHAPDGGVAQGVIHGVVIRHHGRNGQEVKGQEEENAQTPVRMTMTMDEMERHCEALEPM